MSLLTNILIILALVAVAGAAVFILGNAGIEPFLSLKNTVTGWIGGFNIGDAVSNPATLVTVVGSAASVGGLALTQINKVKSQATSSVAAANDQISSLSGSIETQKAELESTQLNLTNAETKIKSLESQLAGVQPQISALQKDKQSLTTQLEAQNNILARASVLAENKEVVRTLIK